MEKTAKVTSKDILNSIIALVDQAGSVEFETVSGSVVTGDDIVAYAAKTIDQITAKNEKAKERAAKKRAEGDALYAAIKAALSDEYATIADIIQIVDADDVTPSKVAARLSTLIKEGYAEKTDVKVGDRKIKAYKIACESDEISEDDAE